LAVIGDHGNELLLPPPDGSAATHARWLKAMRQWRSDCRRDINYTGEIYEVAQLKWTQTSFVEPQVHPFDRYFYNRETHSYTLDRFLDDLVERYGGIDSVLVWPTCERKSACVPGGMYFRCVSPFACSSLLIIDTESAACGTAQIR
jgi:hypothetical protein